MQLVEEVEKAMELDCIAELPFMRKLGEQTRCTPQHFILVGVLLYGAALVGTSVGHSLLLFIAGVLVPVLHGLRIFGRQTGPEARKWLIYWMVFSLAFGAGSGPLPLLTALPFFRLALSAALGLLYCPGYRMGETLYTRALHPLWLKYRSVIGEMLALAEEDRAKSKKD